MVPEIDELNASGQGLRSASRSSVPSTDTHGKVVEGVPLPVTVASQHLKYSAWSGNLLSPSQTD